MKGTIVLTRLYDGKPALLRLWYFNRKTAYLADETEYARLSTAGGFPIGFPREDVFECPEALGASMLHGIVQPIDWSEMRQWAP